MDPIGAIQRFLQRLAQAQAAAQIKPGPVAQKPLQDQDYEPPARNAGDYSYYHFKDDWDPARLTGSESARLEQRILNDANNGASPDLAVSFGMRNSIHPGVPSNPLLQYTGPLPAAPLPPQPFYNR